MKRLLFSAFLLLTMFGLAGCGGSGTDPIDVDTPLSRYRLTINWAERSRNINAPGSALSAVVRLIGANVNRGDVVFTANRDANPAAHSQTYESDDRAYIGNRQIEVTFFADANGTGSVVAIANATIPILGDGTIQNTITNIQKAITSVEVSAGQSLLVGEQKFLTFTARGTGGEIIAVSPGSARFSVANGADKLSVNGIVAQGLAAGVASVAATVDTVTSSPADVTVQPQVKIALVANGQDPQVIAFLQQLQALSITPTRFDAIPDPGTLQQFDVLMVGASGNIGTADAGKVEAFLNAGKGAVLLSGAPRLLATGNIRNSSTSSISSWFAGVKELNQRYYVEYSARANSGSFPLPTSILPGNLVYADNEVWYVDKDDIQNPTVDQVLKTQNNDYVVGALAYELPSGGRIYWQFHPYGPKSEYSSKVLSLLIAGTNWTAKR